MLRGPLVSDPGEPDLSATAPSRGWTPDSWDRDPYLDKASTWRKRTGSRESPAHPHTEAMAGGLDRSSRKVYVGRDLAWQLSLALPDLRPGRNPSPPGKLVNSTDILREETVSAEGELKGEKDGV